MSKAIYLVRHGETEANRAHRHQHHDEPLSDVGKAQAHEITDYLKTLKPDTLITSPFTRARETAEIIGEETNLPLTIAESVHEIRRPEYLYGHSHFSPLTAWYLLQLFWHRGENGWKDGKAENMFDVRNRVHDIKDMLMEEPGERIIVVTHSFFISMFIQLVCQEDALSLRQFIKLVLFAKKSPNTTVVHMKYNPDYIAGTCPWILVEVR